MSGESFEKWAERMKEYLHDYGELVFTKTNADSTFVYRIRVISNPYRVERYFDNDLPPSSAKVCTSEEECFDILREEVYPEADFWLPDYSEAMSEKVHTYRFELALGYPRGFDMEDYSEAIDDVVQHLNSNHDDHIFKIIDTEISGGSFDLMAFGDSPDWQERFIRLLLEKVDLSAYRVPGTENEILKYEETS